MPPRGVFTDPKPTTLRTVPACTSCNSSTKLDDEYFRWVVVANSAEDETAKRLFDEKVLPRFLNNPATLYSVMRDAITVELTTEAGLFVGSPPVFKYDRNRIAKVVEKTVRGLYRWHTKNILRLDSNILRYFMNPKLGDDAAGIITMLPLHEVGGNDFSYRYWIDEQDPEMSFWFLMFFGRTLFFTMTLADKYTPPLGENGVG